MSTEFQLFFKNLQCSPFLPYEFGYGSVTCLHSRWYGRKKRDNDRFYWYFLERRIAFLNENVENRRDCVIPNLVKPFPHSSHQCFFSARSLGRRLKAEPPAAGTNPASCAAAWLSQSMGLQLCETAAPFFKPHKFHNQQQHSPTKLVWTDPWEKSM